MAQINPIFAEASRLGMPAVGMTDHGNMYGSSDFYKQAVKTGIKPIIGIEAYVAPESRFNKKRVLWGEKHQKGDDVAGSGAYTHMTMVAENATGLRNLFLLSSLASYEGQLGKWARMDAEILAEHSEGIIATSGCPSGEIQTRLRLGHHKEAYEAAEKWQSIFGKDNFFLELMDHGIDIERRATTRCGSPNASSRTTRSGRPRTGCPSSPCLRGRRRTPGSPARSTRACSGVSPRGFRRSTWTARSSSSR